MAAVQTPNNQIPEAGKGAPPSHPRDSFLPAPQAKHVYVRDLFDGIAPRYDLLNSLMSARFHHRWRAEAVRQARLQPGDSALDVCTGTGDFAFALARQVGPGGTVVGTDFSQGMLSLADDKRARTHAPNLTFSLADAQALPFGDNTFEAATVGFGIRNVADVAQGIREMARVVKPGGRVVILEMNRPQQAWLAALYRGFSFTVMPLLGSLVAGKKAAYSYLPASVEAFLSREALAQLMEDAGLANVRVTDMGMGAVVVHCGVKKVRA